MKNINEHNKVIKSIISEIDNQLGEKKLLNEFVGLAAQIFGAKTVNYILRNGGKEYLKRKVKEKAEQLGGAIEQEVTDLFSKPNLTKSGKYDYDATVKEIDAIHADIREKLSTLPSDYSDETTSTEIVNPYAKVGIRFRDTYNLIVSYGGADDIKKSFRSGAYEEFRIITEKKTYSGYITKLRSDKFENNLELLVYTSDRLKFGVTRCVLQLYYNNKFAGTKEQGDIRIESLK